MRYFLNGANLHNLLSNDLDLPIRTMTNLFSERLNGRRCCEPFCFEDAFVALLGPLDDDSLLSAFFFSSFLCLAIPDNSGSSKRMHRSPPFVLVQQCLKKRVADPEEDFQGKSFQASSQSRTKFEAYCVQG